MYRKRLFNSLISIVFIFILSGCDFFGKKKDEPKVDNSGQLSNGTSVVGVWTYNYASTADDRNPKAAFSETYIFDPIGNVRIELKDLHKTGISCIGYGVYKVIDNDVAIFMQASSSSMCGFNPQINLNEVEVTPNYLKYHDVQNDNDMMYFAERKFTTGAPYGLWDFHGVGADEKGDGGIDWILFDSKGYFLLQTRFSGKMYLLLGYYTMNPKAGVEGGISLTFFSEDPTQTSGEPLIFDQLVTNNMQLELLFSDGQGGVGSYLGDKL